MLVSQEASALFDPCKFVENSTYQAKWWQCVKNHLGPLRLHCICCQIWSDLHVMCNSSWCNRLVAKRCISRIPTILQVVWNVWKVSFHSDGSFSPLEDRSSWWFIALGRYSIVIVFHRRIYSQIFLLNSNNLCFLGHLISKRHFKSGYVVDMKIHCFYQFVPRKS